MEYNSSREQKPAAVPAPLGEDPPRQLPYLPAGNYTVVGGVRNHPLATRRVLYTLITLF